MTRRRTLVIGLDGYEPSIADALIAEGRLPHLAALRDRSACFPLEHGDAMRTGLAWEHVSLGQTPAASGRWTVVRFDPERYEAHRDDTTGRPFLADCDVRAVIFDAPYFDLTRTPNCRGLTHWGAHDPGVSAHAVPAALFDEVHARFGAYPASRYIYGFVWPSADAARAMAAALVRGLETRTAVARWLCGERFPDWDVALVVVSEFHSAIEALWHGIDPRHPLHSHESASPARDGIVGVYEAADRMLGELAAAFPDAALVVFSMHGMGPNDSDVATMVLLPELLYRARFGRPFFVPRPEWSAAAHDLPPIGPLRDWGRAVNACLGDGTPLGRRSPMTRAIAEVRRRLGVTAASSASVTRFDWMPAALYRRAWPEMDAFALPAFYDGRIRVNVAGRERRGRVAVREYRAACDRVGELLAACRNPRTGEPIVEHIEVPCADDPLRVDATQADVIVTWRGAPLAFEHPQLGMIGPAPYRRTGGHSGGHGIAYVAADGVAPGFHKVRSSFDVVPTIIDLLGVPRPAYVSGTSMLPAVTLP